MKKEKIDKDNFSSQSLRNPDGKQIQLKRPVKGDPLSHPVPDPGTLTTKDRVYREIDKKTKRKRLDPWTGNMRWSKARYDENNEDPDKNPED